MSAAAVEPAVPSSSRAPVQQTSRSWKSEAFTKRQRAQHARKAEIRQHSEAEQAAQQQQVNFWRFQQAIIRENFPKSWLNSISLPTWLGSRRSAAQERHEIEKRQADEERHWIQAQKPITAVNFDAYQQEIAGTVLAQGTIWRPRLEPQRDHVQTPLQTRENTRETAVDDGAIWPSPAEYNYEGQERQSSRTFPNFGRRFPIVRDWNVQHTRPLGSMRVAPVSKPWEAVPALPPYWFDRLRHNEPPLHSEIFSFGTGCPIEYPWCCECRRHQVEFGFLEELYTYDEEGNLWPTCAYFDDTSYNAAVDQYQDDVSVQNMEHFIPWDLLQAINKPESYPAQVPAPEGAPFELFARRLALAASHNSKGERRVLVTPEESVHQPDEQPKFAPYI